MFSIQHRGARRLAAAAASAAAAATTHLAHVELATVILVVNETEKWRLIMRVICKCLPSIANGKTTTGRFEARWRI